MSQYADVSDLYGVGGAPVDAFGSLTDPQKLAGIEAASAEIDSALRSRGPLPLVRWGDDVRVCCVKIATLELLKAVGFNPNAGADKLFVDNAADARLWLLRVARGEMHPDVEFSAPAANYAPSVRSRKMRGF